MIKIEYSIQGGQNMGCFYMVLTNKHFLKNDLFTNSFMNLVD